MRVFLGDAAERRHRLGAARRGDDQRLLGRGDPFGERRDHLRIGVRRRGDVARLHRAERLRQRRRQRLARQRQIDRPARARHGHLIGARDDVGDLLGHAQLVVPLHRLAQHAGLVEHLLAPVDVAVAAAELALLGDRRAAGGEDQRDVVAVEVDDVVDGVGGADVDVQHHRLRPAGHGVGAVRHGDREVLVRDHQRLRHLGVGLLGAAEGLDDRREVGARVGEEIVDAVVGERAQERLSGDRRALVALGALRLGAMRFRPLLEEWLDHSGPRLIASTWPSGASRRREADGSRCLAKAGVQHSRLRDLCCGRLPSRGTRTAPPQDEVDVTYATAARARGSGTRSG